MRSIPPPLPAIAVRAIPAALRSQPMPAPAGVTYNRTGSISGSGAVDTPLLPPAATPRSSILTRNLRIGAIAGAVGGLVAAQFVSIGCADNVTFDITNTEIRNVSSGCSEARQRLLFSAYSSVSIGALGSTLGLAIGLLGLSAGRPEKTAASPTYTRANTSPDTRLRTPPNTRHNTPAN